MLATLITWNEKKLFDLCRFPWKNVCLLHWRTLTHPTIQHLGKEKKNPEYDSDEAYFSFCCVQFNMSSFKQMSIHFIIMKTTHRACTNIPSQPVKLQHQVTHWIQYPSFRYLLFFLSFFFLLLYIRSIWQDDQSPHLTVYNKANCSEKKLANKRSINGVTKYIFFLHTTTELWYPHILHQCPVYFTYIPTSHSCLHHKKENSISIYKWSVVHDLCTWKSFPCDAPGTISSRFIEISSEYYTKWCCTDIHCHSYSTQRTPTPV